MWRILVIGLVGLAIVRELIVTLEAKEHFDQLSRITGDSTDDINAQVAWKAVEVSESVTQALREGWGLCILIVGLGGLSLWSFFRRRSLSRRDLLRVVLRTAIFGGLLGLWFWRTSSFLQSVQDIETMGVPSPLRELRYLVPFLHRELPVIASSWILLLVVVALLLDWSILPSSLLSRRPLVQA